MTCVVCNFPSTDAGPCLIQLLPIDSLWRPATHSTGLARASLRCAVRPGDVAGVPTGGADVAEAFLPIQPFCWCRNAGNWVDPPGDQHGHSS